MNNPYLDEFEDGRRDFRLTAAMMDFGSEVSSSKRLDLLIKVVGNSDIY